MGMDRIHECCKIGSNFNNIHENKQTSQMVNPTLTILNLKIGICENIYIFTKYLSVLLFIHIAFIALHCIRVQMWQILANLFDICNVQHSLRISVSNAFYTALCRLCAQQSATIAQMSKSFALCCPFCFQHEKKCSHWKRDCIWNFFEKTIYFDIWLVIWNIF